MTQETAGQLGRRVAAGAFYTVLMQIGDRVLGVVSTLVLARLLVPADFGLVAMATAFAASVELLAAWGIDAALIQKQELEPDDYHSAWTLAVLLCAGVGLLLLVASPFVADFFREPRLIPIMWCLAAGTFVTGFANKGVVDFRRQFRFDRDLQLTLGARVIQVVAGLTAAFVLRSYWALVLGIVVGRVAWVALTYLMHPLRPRWCTTRMRGLVGFSKWMFGASVVQFALERFPDFVLGRSGGGATLGLYRMGSEIAQIPTTAISMPINRATLPAYSKAANDLRLLAETYIGIAGVIWLLALPAAFGLAVISEPLVAWILGAKWAGAAPFVGILAIGGAFSMIAANTWYVFIALGRPRLTVYRSALQLLMALGLAALLIRPYGALGVAAAIAISAALVLPITYVTLVRALGMRWGLLWSRVWRPAVGVAVMTAVVRLYLAEAGDVAAWVQALTGTALGAATYGLAVWLAWYIAGRPGGAEASLLELMRQGLDRLRK